MIETVQRTLFEARIQELREELNKQAVKLALYRRVLIENNIEPPDLEGEELLALLASCREVITASSELAIRLGSSAELVVGW